MQRRQLLGLGATIGATSLAGCVNFLGPSSEWSFESLATSLEIGEGVVYALGPTGLRELDSGSGEQQWRFDPDFDPFVDRYGPFLTPNYVYVGHGSDLHKVDRATGIAEHTYEMRDAIAESHRDGDRLYLEYPRNIPLQCFELSDEVSSVWESEVVTDEYIDVSPAGTVYALSREGDIVALDGETGALDAREPVDTVRGLVALDEGPVVLEGRAPDRTIVAYDATLADVRWERELVSIQASGTPDMYAADNYVVLTGGEEIGCLDTGGELRWQAEIGSPRAGYLTADRAYIGAKDDVFVFDLASGEEVWQYTLNLPVIGDANIETIVGASDVAFICEGEGHWPDIDYNIRRIEP